jgi:hypothetical protein
VPPAALLETLTKSFETLEAIQKSLEEYLETKRVAFPRCVGCLSHFVAGREVLALAVHNATTS